MSKNYDNWERLVEAVLRREQFRQLALCDSISSSFSSARSSSFSSISQFSEKADHQQELISNTDYLRSGKKWHMLAARDLTIAWGNTPAYWKWKPHPDSGFREVAELVGVWWLDIRGKIKTRLLSPKTCYAAFLAFKLTEWSGGLEEANAIIRFVDDEPDKVAERRAHIVHLQRVENIRGKIAVIRADGWMEVEMGNFYYDEGDEGEVEVRLLGTKWSKSGLIVEGIEFRPTYKEASSIFKKKQVQGRHAKKGRRVFSVFHMRKTN